VDRLVVVDAQQNQSADGVGEARGDCPKRRRRRRLTLALDNEILAMIDQRLQHIRRDVAHGQPTDAGQVHAAKRRRSSG